MGEYQRRTGKIFPVGLTTLALVATVPLIVFFSLGQPITWDIPVGRALIFRGSNITPNYLPFGSLWRHILGHLFRKL